MKQRAVAIIQARMSSSRLPGKMMEDLGGMPVIAWGVRAAKAIPGIDDVWVATSVDASDDVLAQWCQDADVYCYRGDLNDVLARYLGAAQEAKADIVIRITGDCPFLDPQISGAVLKMQKMTNADYVSNALVPLWPNGLETEAFKYSALEEAGALAKRPAQREHVTPFLYQNRHRYQVRNMDCSIPGLGVNRWTLDTPADLAFLRAVAVRLPAEVRRKEGRAPSWLEVARVLEEEPSLFELNAGQKRNEGFDKSRAKIILQDNFSQSQMLTERNAAFFASGEATSGGVFLTHGEGGRVLDVDGNEYIDLGGGSSAALLGHSDPDILFAVRTQLGRGCAPALGAHLKVPLAERLKSLIPFADAGAFFGSEGAAIDTLARHVRAYTAKPYILVGNYLSEAPAFDGLTHVLQNHSLEAIEQVLSEGKGQIAAFVAEAAGYSTLEQGYFPSLQKLLASHGVLFVLDERLTGFRYAEGGAAARLSITPDVVLLGNSLANGMAIAALAGRDDILRNVDDHASDVNALSLAASLAMLMKMQSTPIIPKMWENGQALTAKIAAMIHGAGLSEYFTFHGEAPCKKLLIHSPHIVPFYLSEMRKHGVLLKNNLHCLSYAHAPAEISHVLAAYEGGLANVSTLRAVGDEAA